MYNNDYILIIYELFFYPHNTVFDLLRLFLYILIYHLYVTYFDKYIFNYI